MPRLTLHLILTALVLPSPLAAQDGVPAARTELAAAHAAVAGDLQAAAEQMPADTYGYRPVPTVRSFAQTIAHVAGGQFLYCSQGGGQRLDAGVVKQLNEIRPFSDVDTAAGSRTYTKEELVSLLAASTAFCRTVYLQATPPDAKAVRALIGNVAHDNEHYGNLVTYLRLNGLVPPSTQRRSGPNQRPR